MSDEEYIMISALLRPEQIEGLDRWAKDRGVRGRQVPIRMAVDLFLSKSSLCSTIELVQQEEQPTQNAV